MEPFTYTRLDPTRKQIRVLCLEPGSRGDPLKGSFEITSIGITRSVAYETISYVWGDPAKNQPVIISGKTLLVPTNTAAVLSRVRYATAERRLWIDAVCINQRDTTERSQQVAFMCTIYSSSRGNLIHLIDDEEAGHRMFQLVQTLEHQIRDETNDYREFRRALFYENGSMRLRDIDFQSGGDCDTLREVFQLPWFRRLWVVQEARLAPSNLCILGASQCELKTLLRVAEWFLEVFARKTPEDVAVHPARWVQCIHELFDATDRELGWFALHNEKGLNLHSLLLLAQYFEKTEPRDGVFAILSMLPEAARELAPDYMKSVASVLREATRLVLSEAQNLNFLARVDSAADELEAIDGSTWVFRADRSLSRPQPTHLPWNIYDASRGLNQNLLPPSQNSAILEAQGMLIDEVQMLTPVSSDQIWGSTRQFKVWLSGVVESLINAQTGGFKTSEPNSLARLADVVTCGAALDGTHADSDAVATITRYLASLLRARRQSGGEEQLLSFSRDGRRENGEPKDEGLLEDRSGSLMDLRDLNYLFRDFGYLFRRRLFLTQHGRFGMGLAVVRSGDRVVILGGGNFPFILRPSEENPGEYRFVGMAYVNGVMHGEGVSTHLEGGGQEQVFKIR